MPSTAKLTMTPSHSQQVQLVMWDRQSYTNDCLDTHLFLGQASASLASLALDTKTFTIQDWLVCANYRWWVYLCVEPTYGYVAERLATGSEQVTLQAAERYSDSYWKNCGDPRVAMYRTGWVL